MTIDRFRDLILSILGIVAIIVLIFVTMLQYSLYVRGKKVLDNVIATTDKIQSVSTFVTDEVAKPLSQLATIIRGICQGFGIIDNFFKKRREK
ncbi:MAG: hypothetical protein V1767_03410 [Chloroflexota bacterium]